MTIGETQLEVWGHKGMDECIHTTPDGSLWLLIGSPNGKVALKDVQEDLLSNDFELPWDGRVILLRVMRMVNVGQCGTIG